MPEEAYQPEYPEVARDVCALAAAGVVALGLGHLD